MIPKRLITHNWRNVLLTAAVLLSATLTAVGAAPATRPAGSDPAGNLRGVLPAGWSLWGTARIARTDLHPGMQWSRVPTAYMKLRSTLVQTKEGLQREAPPIIVWIAQQQAQKAKWMATENQLDIEQKSTEYLGSGSGHHVYVHLPPVAVKLWPTARLDIGKALGIKVTTTQPAEAGEERSVVSVTQKGDAVSYTLDDVFCADIKAVGEALTKISKDTPLIIQIETNVPADHVAKILAIARKLRLTKVSVSVVRTSSPPAKPAWKPPL